MNPMEEAKGEEPGPKIPTESSGGPDWGLDIFLEERLTGPTKPGNTTSGQKDYNNTPSESPQEGYSGLDCTDTIEWDPGPGC